MKHCLTGLDHPVIGVKDLPAARDAFERLGFVVPPRGSHREWGTGNWCIQFERDYLELRGVIEPRNVPQNRELAAFLQRREGLMGIAFGTIRARDSYESFLAAGLNPRPVKPLTRDFELPEGLVPVSFELCFLPRDTTPGLMHVVVCEHLTPERLRRPEWLEHPNGAASVKGLVAVSSNPHASADAWSALFENVAPADGGLRARVGDGELLLLNPNTLRDRYPGIDTPAASDWPCIAAVVLGTHSFSRSRDWLLTSGVGVETAGRLIVPPENACGTLIEFATCRIRR